MPNAEKTFKSASPNPLRFTPESRLRRAEGEIGDDEADVEIERGRLDACDGAALAVPGFGLVPRLSIIAKDHLAGDGALGAHGISRRLNFRDKGFDPARPKT